MLEGWVQERPRAAGARSRGSQHHQLLFWEGRALQLHARSFYTRASRLCTTRRKIQPRFKKSLSTCPRLLPGGPLRLFLLAISLSFRPRASEMTGKFTYGRKLTQAEEDSAPLGAVPGQSVVTRWRHAPPPARPG